MKNQPTIICLMGPTASGKTRLAIELVQRFPCEIISVDSAMVYRGMDIGTAKPNKTELTIAPHRLIDIRDPAEIYSAGQFREDALREIADILQQGKIPLLVGGTMLYFHRLQNGIAELPSADAKIRENITNEALQFGWEVMHKKLQSIDAAVAQRIHPHDAQRIQRALEVYYVTGSPLSELQKIKDLSPSPYLFQNLILAPVNRDLLRQRIAIRFQKMLAQGFIDEVKQLHQRKDLHVGLPSIRTVGYRQAWAYLNNEYDFTTMQEKAIIATRQLAKRQFTWLRSWQNAHWFDAEDRNVLEKLYTICKK